MTTEEKLIRAEKIIELMEEGWAVKRSNINPLKFIAHNIKHDSHIFRGHDTKDEAWDTVIEHKKGLKL